MTLTAAKALWTTGSSGAPWQQRHPAQHARPGVCTDTGPPGRGPARAGQKLGAALLQDAVNRAMVVAENTGVRALLVHALHERARQFYEHYGFQASPVDAMVLMVRVRA